MGTTSAPTQTGIISTGAGRMVFGTFTMATSYATGGDTVAGGPAGLGVNSLDNLIVMARNTGQIAAWDGGKSTVKILFYGYEPTTDTSGIIALTQEASASDFSTITVDYIAFGR